MKDHEKIRKSLATFLVTTGIEETKVDRETDEILSMIPPISQRHNFQPPYYITESDDE